MVVRMRHTRAHTRNRRSHHALKVQGLGSCATCNTPKMRHHACASCGNYRGRQVVDTTKALAKKTQAGGEKK
ncbi:MAG: 50S ribosomal protein L32 [bacterium]|nr:50S ribosomal protein L32 [bacterium]